MSRPSKFMENSGAFEAQQFDIGGLSEQKALENHRLATFMLTQMDRKLPTLQEMREDNAQREDLAYIKNSIRTSKENHMEDLQRLYIIQGEEFREEQMDRYISKGDLPKKLASDLASAAFKKQEALYTETRKPHCYTSRWNDDTERVRRTHIFRLLHLEEQQRGIRIREEKERQIQDARFPISIEDFKRKPNNMKLRAARFLNAEKSKQEKMLVEFQWTPQQVEPLMEIFQKDPSFSGDIVAMMIAESGVRDPRKPKA